MTYEEYKNKNKCCYKNKWLKKIIEKVFTIVIFTIVILIISNFNSNFRNFLINDVLNSTMDFSKVNKLISKMTNIFNEKRTEKVNMNVINNKEEKYLDGKKIYINEDKRVFIKDSGIVTFIGKKEGYGNTVIVQQSNGYYSWYGNIKETIKIYDYIEKGNQIGEADQFYYYVLLKDDKPITNEN